MDQALTKLQNAQSAEQAAAPIAYIVQHAQEAPAPHLFIASASAVSSDKLEDAAFLFYIAQMRARYDLSRFPPKGSGGNSPGVALAAMSQQIGAVVNPSVMREPKTFSKVIARVNAWQPQTPAKYSPGWEYATTNPDAGKKMLDTQRAAFNKQFGALATLLNDPQYFAAFKVVQQYNLDGSPSDDERIKAKSAAEATMTAIEKKKDIEGLYYRRTPAPAPAAH